MKLRKMLFGMLAVVAMASCTPHADDKKPSVTGDTGKTAVDTNKDSVKPANPSWKVTFHTNYFGGEGDYAFSTVNVDDGQKVARPEEAPHVANVFKTDAKGNKIPAVGPTYNVQIPDMDQSGAAIDGDDKKDGVQPKMIDKKVRVNDEGKYLDKDGNVVEDVNKAEILYSYNSKGSDGKDLPSKNVTVGGEIVKDDKGNIIYQSTDYRFAGWYTTGAARTRFNFDSPIVQNTDVYAKWVDATDIDVVSLVGDFNHWNPAGSEFVLTTDPESDDFGVKYSIKNVPLHAYGSIQVIKNHGWNGQMNIKFVNKETSKKAFDDGYIGGTNNIVIAKAGVFDFDVDLGNSSAPVTITAVKPLEGDPVSVKRRVVLMGGFNKWNKDDTVYEFKTTGDHMKGEYKLTCDMKAGQEFKPRVLDYDKDNKCITPDSFGYCSPSYLDAETAKLFNTGNGGDPNVVVKTTGSYTWIVTLPASGYAGLAADFHAVLNS